MAVKSPNPKHVPKPYEQITYPGQRVQIDVKFFSASCLVGEAAIDGGYYQFTSLDEYNRFRYLEAFKDHRQDWSTIYAQLVVFFGDRIPE